MNDSQLLYQRDAGERGSGVFAASPIARGSFICRLSGDLLKTDALSCDLFALQVGEDLWLTSPGGYLDDYINHSCDANAGFTDGKPVLYALRDIAKDEEITFDYSTAMNEAGWELECLCGAEHCRGVVRPFQELPEALKERLSGRALDYLRRGRQAR